LPGLLAQERKRRWACWGARQAAPNSQEQRRLRGRALWPAAEQQKAKPKQGGGWARGEPVVSALRQDLERATSRLDLPPEYWPALAQVQRLTGLSAAGSTPQGFETFSRLRSGPAARLESPAPGARGPPKLAPVGSNFADGASRATACCEKTPGRPAVLGKTGISKKQRPSTTILCFRVGVKRFWPAALDCAAYCRAPGSQGAFPQPRRPFCPILCRPSSAFAWNF